jgi:hypothetical protein
MARRKKPPTMNVRILITGKFDYARCSRGEVVEWLEDQFLALERIRALSILELEIQNLIKGATVEPEAPSEEFNRRARAFEDMFNNPED